MSRSFFGKLLGIAEEDESERQGRKCLDRLERMYGQILNAEGDPVQDVLDKEIKIALNLNNLKQVLKRASASDVVILELEENKFKVTIKANTTRTFYLPIIELDDKEQKIPSLNFPVSIKTDASILNEAIEDVSIVAESVRFGADANKFTISAEGDLSKAKVEIPSDDNTTITKEGEEVLKAKYSIEYLKKMIQASKLSSQVYIRFNTDYPLKLEFKAMDQLSMSFILAPRVDND